MYFNIECFNMELIQILHSGLCSTHTYPTSGIYSCTHVLGMLDVENAEPRLIDYFFEFINFNSHFNCCLNFPSDGLISTITKILKHHKLNYNILKRIVSNPAYDICFKESKFKPSYEMFHVIESSRYNWSNDLIDYFFENFEINKNYVIRLCQRLDEYMSYKLAQFVDKCDDNFDQKVLYDAIAFMPDSKNVVLALLGKGCIMDSNCVQIVAKNCEPEILDEILTNYGIIPSVDHFNALINKRESEGISKLVKQGYKFTNNDIKSAIAKQIDLTTIDENLVIDINLFDYCMSYKVYPLRGFSRELGEQEIISLCRIGSLDIIKKIFQNKIVNEDCMVGACERSNGVSVIKFLIDKGGVITNKCVKACLEHASKKVIIPVINNFFRLGSIPIFFKK